jgi:hypothetical protein
MENKNIVYIDESNISANIGHSVYASIFIICSNKELVSLEMANIEKDLKISYTHWVDMPWRLRVRFSERIKKLDFVCKVAVCVNPIEQENSLEYFLTQIINKENNIYRITIDGKKGKRYEQKLKHRLKNHGFILKDIMFLDDKKEILIRLADFMAGLVRSYTDDKNRYNQYMFETLKHKIKILN